MKPGESDDAGFSLLEVLVAITLFIITATVTAQALVGDIVAGRKVKERTQASNIAQSVLAEMQHTKTVTPGTTVVQGYSVRISATTVGGTCTVASGATRQVTILVFAKHGATVDSRPTARTDSVLAC